MVLYIKLLEGLPADHIQHIIEKANVYFKVKKELLNQAIIINP